MTTFHEIEYGVDILANDTDVLASDTTILADGTIAYIDIEPEV